MAERDAALSAQDTAEAQRDTALAERDARPTQAAYDAVVAQRYALPTQTAYDAVVAERDARYSFDQIRNFARGDTLIGVHDGMAKISMKLMESSDLVLWSESSVAMETEVIIDEPH